MSMVFFRRLRSNVILLPLLMVIPMARVPNAIEKEVVLTGRAATSVAKLLGLSSAGSVSLPLSRGDGWAVYLLKKDTPEKLLNDNNHAAPLRHNVLRFSPSPTPSLHISPYWLDLSTGNPWRPGSYSFSSPFLTKEPDAANPWSLLLQGFKKEIPPAEWRAMEKGERGHSIQRCFSFEKNLELCIIAYGWAQQKQEGYTLEIRVRDTTFPTPEQELAQLQALAKKGDAEAQHSLGWKYLPLSGGNSLLRPDSAQAAFWFRKAAEQGHWGAQVQLSILYVSGESLPQDGPKALAWLHTAIERGNKAHVELHRNVKLRVDAERGEAQAQYGLGLHYEEGKRGVAQDEVKAEIWFRKAAEQGHLGAQDRLRTSYAHKKGMASHEASATLLLAHLQKSAEQGDMHACAMLGEFYASGWNGVTKDLNQALAWFHKAIALGNSDAAIRLGQFYLFGESLPLDNAQALFYFRKAAEQGHKDAQALINVALGRLRAEGKGTSEK